MATPGGRPSSPPGRAGASAGWGAPGPGRSLRRAAAAAAAPAGAGTVVVGDIGGTNARLQLWEAGAGAAAAGGPLRAQVYPTQDYGSFQEALSEFLEGAEAPRAGAFAVAGPIEGDHERCDMPNCGWTLDAAEISAACRLGVVKLLNDFEAVGYGVPAVAPDMIVDIHAGETVAKGPKVVLGPGTGFGQAQLFWNEDWGTYQVYPSEGGHADFSPRGWKQRQLNQHVEALLGCCETEHVCCGDGLVRIYDFLRTDQGSHRAGVAAPDLDAPGVSRAALADPAAGGGAEDNPLAREAVDIFLSILGQEAGNWGLRSLATGGVYIAGGITPRLRGRVELGEMRNAFLHRKSRFTEVLQKLPLKLVLDGDVGLLGAREYARNALRLFD